MIDCERWDVVTALFPFTDAPGAGSRWPSDHAIAYLRATGLSHPSLVRWKIFALPIALLGRRIGVAAGMATILS